MTSGLGQALFDPPNVAGWAGGRTWITPSTLLQRGNLLRGVLFPDVKNFRPPDRSMSATDSRVGQRLAQGMGITEATKEGDAESNMMVERDEDYNTRYGGYKGNLLAWERTRIIPRASGRDRLDGDDRRRRRRHASTRSSITFMRRFLRSAVAGRRTVPSWSTFSAASSARPTVRPGEKLEESLRELLSRRVEHAGVPTRLGQFPKSVACVCLTGKTLNAAHAESAEGSLRATWNPKAR